MKETNRILVRLLSGDVTENEVRFIESQSEQVKQDIKHGAALIADLQSLADDPDIMSIANSTDLTLADKVQSHWPAFAIAASLLIAVVAGLGVWGNVGWMSGGQENTDIKRYVTRVGEQKTIALEDGSLLTLNTGTEALVEIAEGSRRVILERGEIYFDVVADPLKPFSVNLGSRIITVLGTKFSALKLPEKYQVAVEEGMVSIHKIEETASREAPALKTESGGQFTSESQMDFGAPAQRRIPAGWVVELDVDTGHLLGYVAEDMQKTLSWRTGLLEFHKEPLYKVVGELNRYTGRKILIEDSDIMNLSVYAAINLKELRNALSGLEQLLPVKVISHYDRIVIVKDEARFRE